jgi:hypothetical protein
LIMMALLCGFSCSSSVCLHSYLFYWKLNNLLSFGRFYCIFGREFFAVFSTLLLLLLWSDHQWNLQIVMALIRDALYSFNIYLFKIKKSFIYSVLLLTFLYESIVGSVVECSPATRAARVRFPDDFFPIE